MTKLIKAECNNIYPLCIHYGFLVGNMVIHNTPSKENAYGGNIIIEPYSDFEKDREIFSIEDVNIPEQQILDYYERNKSKKFNAITFNCQQFVNDVLSGKKGLSIIIKVALIVGIFVAASGGLKKK